MESINIAATDETPAVVLDASSSTFEMKVKSLPEDVTAFYDPILEWLDGYAASPNSQTDFRFEMAYFNTASSKMLLDIMMKLEEIHEDGSTVKIIWCYLEDDEDMEEAGEEYSDIVEVPFDMVAN